MTALSETQLGALLREDSRQGWRAFVDAYTPTLLAQIEWAGITDRDDVLDVYARVCERLAENDCARLRQHDPEKGALAAWLTMVVRRVVVDWVRSRAGRPRLFSAVLQLSQLDQRVFQLHYWHERRPTEIVEQLGAEGRTVSLDDVLEALVRIHQVLSERHRRQVLSIVARSRPAVSLDDLTDETALEQKGIRADPERALQVRELERALSDALAALPSEDAAIVRMMFVHGWPRHEIQRALHLDHLTTDRVNAILDGLRARLAAKGIRSGADAVGSELTFLDGSIM